MITIRPVARALVPVDSEAAGRLSAPNYDEFQDDDEVRNVITANPDSILRVTMAHCDPAHGSTPPAEGSPEALAHANRVMASVGSGPLTKQVEGVLWVYEILDPTRPDVRQIGVGGMGLISEIRTAETPRGSIIRNEGIREAKARGRADLIAATRAIVGTVNNAVDDAGGDLAARLHGIADARSPDLDVLDRHDNRHRIWLVTDEPEITALQTRLAEEPRAYVADGNHRSAAAAMLGHEEFLTVFFPTRTMGIRPYNRLVSDPVSLPHDVPAALAAGFDTRPLPGTHAFQPETAHRIGIYTRGHWYEAIPRSGTFDPTDAAQDIDADIVQRHLFGPVLGIPDARDERLRFVGSNRDVAYLRSEVDRGAYRLAVTLPPVTMDQFVRVCLQDKMMPPKSTWFEPKIRSGLVMALL